MPYTWPVQLTDVKAQLNITSTTYDAELQGFLDAAGDVVLEFIGDIPTTVYTENYDGGDVSIYLRHRPVLTITTMTEVVGNVVYTLTSQPPGSSVDAWGYSIDDADAGKVVRRSAAGQPWRFTPGIGNITVTYSAGRSVLPASVRMAVLLITEHMWEQTQRGQGAGRAVPGAVDADVGYGPNKYSQAMEMLAPYRKAPVIA